MEQTKVIAIVGATASGKTALGVELAKRLDGEVISADSMQIYEGLDIATAKPTQEEMQGIPHHLISIIPRSQRFSVADYVQLANEKIQEVHARGKMPIMVGGTGLYIDSVLSGMEFQPEEDNSIRQELTARLQREGNQALYAELQALDPIACEKIHPNNSVRLIRALEVCLTSGMTFTEYKKKNISRPSPYDNTIIGLDWDREILYSRINKRVDMMVEMGLLEEVEQARGQEMQTASSAIGYKELLPYFDGTATLEDCLAILRQETRRYAKRQLTWFRRNAQIRWLKVYEYDKVQKLSEKAEKIIAKIEKM